MNKHVPVDALEVGMYISEVGNDWIPAKRKKRKGYIRSQKTIDKIKSLGVLEVCIEFPNDTAVKKNGHQGAAEKTKSDQDASAPADSVIKSDDKIVMKDSKHAEKHSASTQEESITPEDSNVAKTDTGKGLQETQPEEGESVPSPEAATASSEGGLLDQDKSEKTETTASSQGGLLDKIKSEKQAEQSSSTGGLLDDIKLNKQETSQGIARPLLREGIAQRAKKYIPGAVVVPFSEEIEKAKTLHSEAKLRVEEAMHLAKIGKSFDIDGIESVADSLIESIISNRNTLSMLTAIKNKSNYLHEHSVNCSVLMGIFARHMKLNFDVIHDMVTGAILHDIGMIEVPEEIINKAGKLTPPEEKEMQRHIVVGRKILEKNRGVPAIAFEVCKQHHERLDGQGYMLKLHGHQVNQYGRVGAIVDIYDALTSDRSYRKAFSPAAAMKKLLELGGGHLDAKLVYQFIQCINIFPVGSLVQLDDSRVGVVHELNIFKKDKPKVRVFYSGKDESYFEAETVDLADPDVRVKIKKTVEIDDFDIDLEDVI